MSKLTAAQEARYVRIAADGFSVKDAKSLAAADAFVALADAGNSTRVIADLVKAFGAKFAPAYGTIARYIKVRKSLPADVTAETFVTTLREVTAARSAAGAGNARANAQREGKPRPTAAPSDSTVDGGTMRVVTAKALADDIMRLIDAAKTLDAADRSLLAALLHAAEQEVMPTIRAVA